MNNQAKWQDLVPEELKAERNRLMGILRSLPAFPTSRKDINLQSKTKAALDKVTKEMYKFIR